MIDRVAVGNIKNRSCAVDHLKFAGKILAEGIGAVRRKILRASFHSLQ